MEYRERVEALVVQLRQRDIENSFPQIQGLVVNIADWIGTLNLKDAKGREIEIIKEMNEVMSELFVGMQKYNIIYLCDLLKYDLQSLVDELKALQTPAFGCEGSDING